MTDSVVGQRLLQNWSGKGGAIHDFVKVMPFDYKRVLLESKYEKDTSADEELQVKLNY